VCDTDDLDDIRYRLRISKLEARLVLREIECAALIREINSPLTSSERRTEATEQWETWRDESLEISEELKTLREAKSI
jgi:hypothetical protein